MSIGQLGPFHLKGRELHRDSRAPQPTAGLAWTMETSTLSVLEVWDVRQLVSPNADKPEMIRTSVHKCVPGVEISVQEPHHGALKIRHLFREEILLLI
jgi:hypothetical protein